MLFLLCAFKYIIRLAVLLSELFHNNNDDDDDNNNNDKTTKRDQYSLIYILLYYTRLHTKQVRNNNII